MGCGAAAAFRYPPLSNGAHKTKTLPLILLDRLGVRRKSAISGSLHGPLMPGPVPPAVFKHIAQYNLDKARALPVAAPPVGGVKAPAVRLPEDLTVILRLQQMSRRIVVELAHKARHNDAQSAAHLEVAHDVTEIEIIRAEIVIG